MQSVELLRENLQILYDAIHHHPESSLLEEHGSPDADDFYAVYELNDEIFFFHFARKTLSRLIVFEDVPAGLAHLHAIT